MGRLWCRLRAALRRMLDGGAKDDELSEEVRAFVEHDAESKIRSGMTPEDARRAALVELGGVEQVKECVRDTGAGAGVEGVFRDIRYAMRSLGRAPGFSSSVIGNLSLGLAATIVAFAFVNGALVRPFPGVRDQDRVVSIGILENGPFGPIPAATASADYPDVFRALGEGLTSLDGLAAFTDSKVAVALPQPRSLPAAFVSPNYFDVLGVQPEIGRHFAREENESAAAVIGHALWTREFGRDPSVVGRPIQVGGQLVQIIGVAPQGFQGASRNMEAGVDLWLPIGLVDLVGDPAPGREGLVLIGEQPGGRVIRYVGRMRDGAGIDRVETELAVIAGRILTPIGNATAPRMADVSRLSRFDPADAVEVIAVILCVPLLVLAIACVNAANLFLVRASRRRREVAVRLALGASRLRLVRQLAIESLVLAICAAIVALPLAWAGLQLGAAFTTFPMPLDATVIAGALVAAFLTALGFGLVPALQASGQRPSASLGTSPAGSGGTRAESRARRALVAGQVALSLGLLATGFQLTSALDSAAEPAGTDPDRLLMASFNLSQLRYSSAESDAFYASLLDGTSRIPGVEAAGLSSRTLGFVGGSSRLWTFSGDAVLVDAGDGPDGRVLVSGSSADGDFFEAVGLDLVQGREFSAADRRDIPDVAIVTERLASRMFGAAALGRSLHVSTGFPGAPEADVRIVGIVESPVEGAGEDTAAIFFPSPFPSPRQPGTARTLYVRSDDPTTLAPAIRDLVARIDPQVPILELATLDQKLRAEMQLERGLARAAAILGIVALLLASVGLYGVTAYSVAMRWREIAVRMALGARPNRVLAMVCRQALLVATIGAVLGGLVAVMAGLVIQAEVFGAASVDAGALGFSAAWLAAAMLLASLLPALRAARLDPIAVLREE